MFFPALIAGPSAAQNRTMKTPCLKCGLIHDEPTAICDGYVGIDPDETAGDTRKKAAERIRAVLAAVPIESRTGRARAAAARAGAQGPAEPIRSSAASPVKTEAPRDEVPEWRREVTERLESYRSRRERQARQSANGQTVLGFRVHSRTETIGEVPEATGTLSAPAKGPVAGQPMPAESAATPSAAEGTSPPAISEPSNGEQNQRVYQPIEEADLTVELAAMGTETAEHAISEVARPESAEATGSAGDQRTLATALPLATEPAVVLADSTTLEIHADPVELAEVQAPASLAAHAPMNLAPLATIPAIDTEYWRAQPEPTEAGRDAEENECGSLTSGFEARAARPPQEAIEEAMAPATKTVEEAAQVAEPILSEGSEEPPPTAAVAHPVETMSSETPLFSEALETSEDEDELIDHRRAALRTAARPHGAATERIEINVPQPVFDFSAASAETQQPQDQGPPVADLRERRCAATFDAVILGLTIAGFFAAFRLAGGELSFSRVGAAVGIAAAFLIYALYILLFTMVGGATPGMLLRGLRVVCFDGSQPEQVELTWRGFGYLLSAAAGMFGFVWSAWDEHGLTWHDRISQTYITYAEAAAAPVAESAS